jgi:hypothetical protein
LAVDDFGKQSKTITPPTKLPFRLDRQKVFFNDGKYWGNHQLQLNKEAVVKNKRNSNTSIPAVILEAKYTYPKNVVKTAFKASLDRGQQVFVTTNFDCEFE